MEKRETAQDAAPQALIESYLEAVRERDLSRCMDFYADDATLRFLAGVFKGKQAIEEWHRERFAAELELVRLDKVKADGDKVTVYAAVTTKRLKAWRLNRVAGTATFTVQQGKIKETKFSPRIYNPREGW